MASPAPVAPAAPATDVAAAAVVNVPLKPGWKTTEMWLTTLLLAGLGTVIEQLVQMLPSLAAAPNASPALVLGLPIAIGALGLAGAWAKTALTKSRTELKLAQSPTPATDNAAALTVNAAVKTGVLLLALGLALVPARAFAQLEPVNCDEVLDAGQPAPAVKLPKGSVLPEDSWVESPAWMCAAGKSQNICIAENSAPPYSTIVVSAAAGGAVVTAIVVAILAGTGHLK